jgi:hypothetical protein
MTARLAIVVSNEAPRRRRGRPRKPKLRYLTADGQLRTWSRPVEQKAPAPPSQLAMTPTTSPAYAAGWQAAMAYVSELIDRVSAPTPA